MRSQARLYSSMDRGTRVAIFPGSLPYGRPRSQCPLFTTGSRANMSLLEIQILKRKVGTRGLEVPRVGLGCVTFGREIDERQSFRMMDYAFERGINLLDTAEAYGAMHA